MSEDAGTLKSLHRALINLNKRAERSANQILVKNFVDSEPLFDLLSTQNNQVIYGRRGTGKTHALKYLSEYVTARGNLAVYIDLRSIGSNTSIYSDTSRTLPDRAATLIVDVLNALYQELYTIALSAIDTAPHPDQLTSRVDDLGAAISTIRVVGTLEQEEERTSSEGEERGLAGSASLAKTPSASLQASIKRQSDAKMSRRVKRTGEETIHLDFGDINSALNGLIGVLAAPRLWLLIDEWSEIPFDLQPYLADLIRRTILPVNTITVKIASIEHRSQHCCPVNKRIDSIG
jgi:hypothetical protein